MKVTLLALGGLLAVASFCSCDNNDDDNNNRTMLNAQDSTFIKMAGMGNTAEIGAGVVADSLSSDTSVKNFAMMMITDHTTAQTQLKIIASKYGMMAPDSVDASHATFLRDTLLPLAGTIAFDSIYVAGQVKDHQRTIALFETERDYGNNEELKGFASGLLPSLQMHLNHADSLAAKY